MAKYLVVLIPTFNRRESLKQALDSLVQCDSPSNYLKTVVVENGPKHGVQPLVQKYEATLRTQYIHEPQRGISHALNRGLKEISDALVIFTNDDVLFNKDYLMAYAETSTHRDYGQFYGGPVHVIYEKQPSGWRMRYLPCSMRGWGLNGLEAEKHRYFLGLNWAAFSEDIKKVGGLNPHLGLGSSLGAVGEETDIQKRLLKQEFEQVFVQNATVVQWVSKRSVSMTRILRRRYQNGLYHGYADQHRNRMKWAHQKEKIANYFSDTHQKIRISELFGWIAYSFYLFGYQQGSILKQRVLT